MPVDIKSHPDFERHNSTHVQQLATAQAAHDEAGVNKADSIWNAAQLEMYSSLSTQAEAAGARKVTMERLKAEYPQVPEGAYTHMTDLDQMEKVVKDIAAVMPAPTGDTGHAAPITPSGTSTTSTSGNPMEDPKHLADLRRRARSGDRDAQDQIKRYAFLGPNGIITKTAKLGPAREEGKKRSGVR